METSQEYEKRIKKKWRPVFIILTPVMLITMSWIFIQGHLEKRNQTRAPRKVYKIIQKSPPNVDEETSVNSSEEVLIETEDVEMPLNQESRETEDVEMPLNQESRETDSERTPTIPNESVNADDEAANTDDEVANERRGAERAALEAWNAEIDEALAESVEIQEEAKAAIAEVVPYILEHLNTLSPQEQRAFLRETKDRMVSQAPPGLQEHVNQNPELVEQGWKIFLQLLVEQGYKPPR